MELNLASTRKVDPEQPRVAADGHAQLARGREHERHGILKIPRRAIESEAPLPSSAPICLLLVVVIALVVVAVFFRGQGCPEW